MDGFSPRKCGGFELSAVLDREDYRDIRKAINIRLDYIGGLPDATHDDATKLGRVIAEICRGWMDLLDAAGAEREGE